MSLRDECIEAIEPFACHSAHAPQALDAVLGVLADRADEWADEANVSLTWRHVPDALIAVLREGDE